MKIKKLFLYITYKLKIAFMKNKTHYALGSVKLINKALKTETDQKKIEGYKKLKKHIDHIHVSEARKQKIKHFDSVRTNGKRRNAQIKK
jgi:hypothetical protein